MAKIFQVKKEINGKEYIFQHNGLSALLKAQDTCYVDGTDIRSSEKLTNYLFENVVISPRGLTADSFDTVKELNDVIGFASEVMQGEHRNLAIGNVAANAAPVNTAAQPVVAESVIAPATF